MPTKGLLFLVLDPRINSKYIGLKFDFIAEFLILNTVFGNNYFADIYNVYNESLI